MNQADLIKQLAEASGNSKKEAEHMLKTLSDVVHAELQQGGEITLPGIGKLSVNNRAARTGRNPKTGQVLNIPAKNVPHFSAAKALKDAANSN